MRKRVAIACWLVLGVTVAIATGSTTVAVLSDEETVPVDVSVTVPETTNESDGAPPENGSDSADPISPPDEPPGNGSDPGDPISPPEEPPGNGSESGNGSITLPVEPPDDEIERENGSTTRPVDPREPASESS